MGIISKGGMIAPTARTVGDSLVASLNGGQHYPQAVIAGKYYEIDPDMDVYIKNSGSPAVYGLAMTTSDAVQSGDTDFTSFTACDFGLNDFSFEWWMTVDGDTTNDPRPFAIGKTGEESIQPVLTVSGGNITNFKLDLYDSAGTRLTASDGNAIIDSGAITGYPADGTFYHFSFTVERGGDGGTATVTFYIDGTPVGAPTFTEKATALAIDVSSISVAGRFNIGATLGNAANANGDFYTLRAYNALLTQAQITTRNGLGPAVLPSDGQAPTMALNMSEYAGWAVSGTPEVRDVSGSLLLSLDTFTGYANAAACLAAIAAITGDAVASTSNSRRIRANSPTVIYASSSYINLYSAPAAGGNVILTPVA